MKKALICFLILVFAFSVDGCGEKKAKTETKGDVSSDNSDTSSTAEDIVDLTKLSSTMVYSEVYNMVNNPESYYGRTVIMRGTFGVYTDENTGKNYFACLIADATACCSQGIEFVLDGEYNYPEDYPALKEEITVKGIFGTYTEGENRYCQLTSAKFL